MDDVDVTEQPAVVEPVEVRVLDEQFAAAADQYHQLRSELDGLKCGTQQEVNVFALHVGHRIKQMPGKDRDALLFALTVQALAGVVDEPAVTIPTELLAQRVAARR